MKPPDPTVFRTPQPLCPACAAARLHAAAETFLHHPFAGHGFDRGRWSDPMLDPLPPLELRGKPDPGENGGES